MFAIIAFASGAAAQSVVSFDKSFGPSTIGPGGISTITFAITNNTASTTLTGMAFTDVLPTVPGTVDIASPSSASTTCPGGGAAFATVTAPDGGGTISFSDGRLGAGASCEVTVNVTATTPGTHTNPAITLTTDQGNEDSIAVDLTVTGSLPGFSKSFAPSSVSLGGRSTATLTIDNTANPSAVNNLDFTDVLPAGMTVASPSNASTTCTGLSPPTVTATPGGSTVVLDADGFFTAPAVAASAVCTVTFDVVASTGGSLTNTVELLADGVSAGFASAALEVTVAEVNIAKEFTDDPVAPGGTVTLRFTLDNFNRFDPATAVAFSDDLTTALPGLTFTSLLSNDCGGSVTGTGSMTVALSGGTIAPGGQCTIEVSLTVPGGDIGGTYTNTTGTVTATVAGSPVVGNTASDDLFVLNAQSLIFSKSFAPDAVAAGSDTVLTFTIDNNNPASGGTFDASDISFTDDITAIAPQPATVLLPTSPCGGSMVLMTGSFGEALLSFSGGTLAENSSCTFDVTITVDPAVAGGTYTNTTSVLSADLNDGGIIPSPPATDDITVNQEINLNFTKVFTDDPVIAGGQATLEFTITSAPDSTADATGITFTDDLDAMLAGAAAANVPQSDVCGTGSSLTQTSSVLTLGGGTLSPGTSCTFSVLVDVPASAAGGDYANTTSALTANGGAVSVGAASDDLTVRADGTSPVVLTKEFTDDPVLPGGTVTLEFEITNPNTSAAATSIYFTDDLDDTLSGLAGTGLPLTDLCGSGNGTLTGSSGDMFLTFSGGSLAGGETCTFSVTLDVPAGATTGSYPNVTSAPVATVSGIARAGLAADDALEVLGEPVTIIKEFTDDPVVAGNNATLLFTIENLSTLDATGISFSDDLGAMGTGFDFQGGTGGNTCPGMSSSTAGDTVFNSPAFGLLAGRSCVIEIFVGTPASAGTGSFPNSTSDLEATVGGIDFTGSNALPGASDTLSTTAVADSADISVTKSDGVTTATPGDSVVYTITVANAGPADDASVSVADSFPAALTCSYTAASTGSATASGFSSGSGDIAQTLALQAGAEVTYTATCDIDPAATGSLSNTVTAFGSVGDPDSGNNSATDVDTLVPSADVQVTKSDSPDPVVAGETLGYTITVTNAGPSDDPGVLLADTFPAGLTCTHNSAAAGSASGNTAAGGGNLSETLSMPAGSSVTYDATCAVDPAATGPLSNTATATASFDPDTANNDATQSTTVLQEADISVTKDNGTTVSVPGTSTTYTITVANAGPSDDPSVSLTDVFPAALSGCSYTSVAAGAASGNTAADTGDLTETLSMSAGSSVTYTATCDIDPAAVGSLTNTATAAASVTDPDSGNDSATDADTLQPTADLSVTKSDAPDPVDAGTDLTYTITVANAGPSTAPAATLADSFPSELQSCSYTSVAAGGATGNTAAGIGDLSETLSLPAGASVTYTATCTVDIAATGPISNTATVAPSAATVDPESSNDSATEDTTVDPAVLVFGKGFVPDTIFQGETSVLTFTIDNTGNAVDATGAAFTDTLQTGITVHDPAGASTTCGGTFTPSPGDSSLSFSGGTVPLGTSCQVQVTVRAVTAGSFPNTTSDLTSNFPTVSGATATLTVNPAGAPMFTKTFAPDTIPQGDLTTLTFEIDNTGNALDGENLAFTDPLPAGVTVAPGFVATNTCGGTFTPTEGDTSLDLTGGLVAAGTTCEISVTLRAITAGTQTNTSGDLTSDTLPAATGPSDDLIVTPADLPGFAKAFDPDTIVQGDVTELTFTIDNTANLIEAADLAFTDDLPAGVSVAATPAAFNDCGGTFAPSTGDTTLDLTGGTVAESATCTIRVTLRAISAGALTNTTGDLTSTLGNSGPASAPLTVTAAPGPVFTKAFDPAEIDRGGTSTLTLTIDNTGNLIEATDLAFTDALPADVSVSDPATFTDGCAGSFGPAAGDTTLSYSGGTVAEGATCDITVVLVAATAGDKINTTSDLASSLGTSSPATATLVVNEAEAPGFAKAFAPDTIFQGETSTLTFTIDNAANLVPLTDLAFTDDLPAGLVVAPAPGAANTCGGSFAPAAGDTSLGFTGGTVPASASCTLSVSVRGLTAGDKVNVSSVLSSELAATSPAATATLTVNALPLTVAKGFAPATIETGGVSRLTISLRNTATLDATSVDITDVLPAGATVAPFADVNNTCGGSAAAAPGATSIGLTGGFVAASGTCSLAVNITSATVGSFNDPTDGVTSSLGTSADASATLTVEPASRGSLTFNVETDTDGVYRFDFAGPSTDLLVEVSGGFGTVGPVTLAVGSYTVTASAPAGVAIVSVSCNDGDSTATLDAVAVITANIDPLEDVTCILRALGSVQTTVETINDLLRTRTNLILESEPDSNRRINRLQNGAGNSTPLTFSNGDLTSMLPFAAQIASDTYSFSTSLLQVRQAAASVALAHGSTKNVAYVENYRFDMWFEGQLKKFDDGALGEGDFAIAYMGADYLVSDRVLLGMLLQVDHIDFTSANTGGTANGTGWMVGPYMTAQLAPNLYFDGRLAAGKSNNKVSPFNTYADRFETTRWLAVAGVHGDFQRGNWTIRPNASLRYIEETQGSYVDSVGATIPGQTVQLGQLQIGPSFTGRFDGPNGEIISPYFDINALYNLGETNGVTVASTSSPAVEGWRGRLKAGVKVTTQGGVQIGLGGSYDGLFRDNFDTWGLVFDLTIPLYKAKAK